MIGIDSTTLVGVFEVVGSTDDTLVGVFGSFRASSSTDDALIGIFGPEVGAGGVGFSWFNVELTSEHVYTAGEGGVGHSWFVVELTEDHVEPPAPPTPTRRPGPVHRPKRRQRLTYRIPGRFKVVESIEVYAGGRFYADRERRFAGTYAVVTTIRQAFNANFAVSDLHVQFLQEEDELILLLLEE